MVFFCFFFLNALKFHCSIILYHVSYNGTKINRYSQLNVVYIFSGSNFDIMFNEDVKTHNKLRMPRPPTVITHEKKIYFNNLMEKQV